MCITYMLFYTAFVTKQHFQIFGEMVQKVLKMRKYNFFFFFFVKYVCMLTDCWGQCNKIVVGTVVCIIFMVFVFYANL